jgi:secreted trypsin-like serine protease
MGDVAKIGRTFTSNAKPQNAPAKRSLPMTLRPRRPHPATPGTLGTLGLLGAGLLGATLLGCGAPASEADAPGETQEAIVGGVADTGDPAIVALYGIAPGADKGALCTATVISPTVVLTAAHCLDPSIVGTGLEYSVLTAADLTDKAHPSPRLKVKETHFDPAFSATNLLNGHDIGVAILDSPTAITPIAWNSDPLPATAKGQSVRIVGYGVNDGFKEMGAGIKRQANVKINDFDNLLVKTGDLSKTICSGDSGGPVLLKIGGVEKVVGVNSFGIIFCLFSGNSTRVDTYASFVKSYL